MATPDTKPALLAGRKIFLSLGLILTSALYSVYMFSQRAANPQKTLTIETVIVPVSEKPPASSPVVNPTPRPIGRYAEGSYTGDAADAYYGTVQVQATIKNGVLADVQFLQYPNDRSTSRYISSKAVPILKNEAIQAQSANVDIVSGATATSQAFRQSLGSALALAKN